MIKTPSLIVDLRDLCSQAKDFLDQHDLDSQGPVKEDAQLAARIELYRRIKEQLDQLVALKPSDALESETHHDTAATDANPPAPASPTLPE